MTRLLCLVLGLLVNAPVWGFAQDRPLLRDMIGQMLLIGFRGTALQDDDPVLRDIREYNLGGVILFDRDVQLGTTARNIASPGQVRALCAQLQRAAAIPLLVGVDQEGGRVRRLREEAGFAPSPSAAVLGQLLPEATRQEGLKTGTMLIDVGINLDFAPVADVNTNPASPVIGALGRSFSDDPHRVANHALAFGEGLKAAGVVSCMKHFPGHGSALADSHLGLTDVSRTWSPGELIPYEELVSRNAVPMIMVGHLYLSQFDSVFPASLSPSVTTVLLREMLGFDGVIVSDDMQMRAIVDHYGLDDAVLRAVQAGADILIFGNNLDYDPDIVPKAVEILVHAVDRGEVSPTRIAASYDRIMKIKAGLRRE